MIFLKRGALGFVVAEKKDETGTVALESNEKDELREQINSKYGVGEGQSPWAVTDIPVNFIRTNLSIQELQPFDETLEDAIKIASVFGIPSVLVPRKDQSTFSNQDTAEKSVYTSVIIPAAKRFCEALTIFLGLDQKGLYLDCDFSDVACLQVGTTVPASTSPSGFVTVKRRMFCGNRDASSSISASECTGPTP